MKVSCPKCKKEVEWEDNPFRPFCSARCKLYDLGDWASEKYGVPGDHSGNDEAESPKPAPEAEKEEGD